MSHNHAGMVDGENASEMTILSSRIENEGHFTENAFGGLPCLAPLGSPMSSNLSAVTIANYVFVHPQRVREKSVLQRHRRRRRPPRTRLSIGLLDYTLPQAQRQICPSLCQVNPGCL